MVEGGGFEPSRSFIPALQRMHGRMSIFHAEKKRMTKTEDSLAEKRRFELSRPFNIQ